jgi:hypothetical protein
MALPGLASAESDRGVSLRSVNFPEGMGTAMAATAMLDIPNFKMVMFHN